MVDEKKLREMLPEILKRPAYRGLHSFAVNSLINDIVEAVKECGKAKKKKKKED